MKCNVLTDFLIISRAKRRVLGGGIIAFFPPHCHVVCDEKRSAEYVTYSHPRRAIKPACCKLPRGITGGFIGRQPVIRRN